MSSPADPIVFILAIFALGVCLGWKLCRDHLTESAKSSRGNPTHLSAKRGEWKPTELLFFPDDNMPCNSYYADKRCWKLMRRERCDYLHVGENSSLIRVMDTLKDTHQIDLCMFRFTLREVAELFEKLHKQGKKIRIITDRSHEPIDNNQIPRLKQCGIAVRERPLDHLGNDRYRPLMHNKFVIVDQKCCLLGSFNWTHQAVTKNSETIIKSYEPSVVTPLMRKFEQMWRELGVAQY